MYGYSIAVMKSVSDWRAIVIQDPKPGESAPALWTGYGATEREALIAAIDQIEFEEK